MPETASKQGLHTAGWRGALGRLLQEVQDELVPCQGAVVGSILAQRVSDAWPGPGLQQHRHRFRAGPLAGQHQGGPAGDGAPEGVRTSSEPQGLLGTQPGWAEEANQVPPTWEAKGLARGRTAHHGLARRTDRRSPALQVLLIHGSPLLQEEAAQIRVTHLSRYDKGRCTQLAGVGGGIRRDVRGRPRGRWGRSLHDGP